MGLRFHDSRPQPRWGLEIAGRFVASQRRVASSLDEQASSGFAVYDVRSYWQARQGLLLTLGVENMFDRYYREHLDLRTGRGVFQPGINSYVGVEMKY
jgi:outer membrane receptor protein involved in Fe transport